MGVWVGLYQVIPYTGCYHGGYARDIPGHIGLPCYISLLARLVVVLGIFG